MHRTPVVLLSLLLSFAVKAETRTWSFVQSVGGLSIAEPVRVTAGWSLPINANVSGHESVTQAPTTLNSALVCESTSAVVEEGSIYIAISTGLARGQHKVMCPPALLGHIAAGAYRVFYRGPGHQPVLVGKIQISP
jgi:hypothetical protein